MLPCPSCDAPLEGDKCAACGGEPIVCGKFRVTKLLGRGGMGVVYAAERVGPAREHKHGPRRPANVAVKIIAPPTDDDWTAWELFERSSKVLQNLHHDSLPKVYAFERTERGRLVLVREAFDGGTLEQRIADSDERIEPKRVRALLDEMLELLEYLQGLVPPVIHRDIKPSNVMFRSKDDWRPVLVDFDTIVSRRTGLTIVGTPGYAAPEQFAADASPASDVYGLGATMLFVATHTDADELPRKDGRFVLDGLLPSLDDKLVSVLRRMVEPDVSKRYGSAREVAADLARPTPKPSPPVVAKAPPPPPPRSRWRRAWWALLPLSLLVIFGFRKRHHADEPWVPPPTPVAEPASTVDNAADERACTGGDGEACFNVALRYDDGTDGILQDYVRAASFYERGCNVGHAKACNNLGVAYEHGYGVVASRSRARDLYESACTKKNGLACRNLGYLYEADAGGGVPYDLAKALAFFERGCDLEDGRACNNLGWLYEEGKATKQDLKKAASLYALACDHGYLYGCRNSAIAYETADGVERDDRRALALFKRACSQDEKSGCVELGRMMLEGRGTQADPSRAAESFQTGCDDGRLEGCSELAKLYAAGKGVQKNVAEAKKLYARACDGGVEGSCGELRSLGR